MLTIKLGAGLAWFGAPVDTIRIEDHPERVDPDLVFRVLNEEDIATGPELAPFVAALRSAARGIDRASMSVGDTITVTSLTGKELAAWRRVPCGFEPPVDEAQPGPHSGGRGRVVTSTTRNAGVSRAL